jgi:electron transfer flavoprotein alpha/beta subunit
LVDQDQPQLVIRGKQAIDDHSDEARYITAALANLSQPTFASKVIGERHSYRLAQNGRWRANTESRS